MISGDWVLVIWFLIDLTEIAGGDGVAIRAGSTLWNDVTGESSSDSGPGEQEDGRGGTCALLFATTNLDWDG
jgi:hypothetical protein